MTHRFNDVVVIFSYLCRCHTSHLIGRVIAVRVGGFKRAPLSLAPPSFFSPKSRRSFRYADRIVGLFPQFKASSSSSASTASYCSGYLLLTLLKRSTPIPRLLAKPATFGNLSKESPPPFLQELTYFSAYSGSSCARHIRLKRVMGSITLLSFHLINPPFLFFARTFQPCERIIHQKIVPHSAKTCQTVPLFRVFFKKSWIFFKNTV